MSEALVPHVLTESVRGRADRLWRAWSGPPWERAARYAAIAACALLFLHAAATFEIVYTIRVSHLLLLVACAVGAPFIFYGWRRLPEFVRWAALGLLAVYLLATALADTTVLPSEGRSSAYRSWVYLADLVFGLAVVGLFSGLWGRGESLRTLCWALVAGAGIGAAYGIYQWFAQRYGLPLEDVNNAVNTDGITRGDVPLGFGAGLFGGERVRGTFVEPHFFAIYLASMLPFAAALAYRRDRWIGWAIAAVLAIGVALALTSSASAWAALAGGAVTGTALVAISRGFVRVAAVAGAVLVVGCLLVAVFLSNPEDLGSATGRSGSELATTTEFRVDTWDRVVDIWSARPVIGFGPGQGAVKLATRLPGWATEDRPRPLVLGTAEGQWSASLLDGGVLAFSAWCLFLGAILYVGGRAVVRRPAPLVVAAFVAAMTAVLGSLVGGDRLDLRVWVLLGLLAAVGCNAHSNRNEGDGKPHERAA